jgi:hypothetical protein
MNSCGVVLLGILVLLGWAIDTPDRACKLWQVFSLPFAPFSFSQPNTFRPNITHVTHDTHA